jgi:hypothetical protein
MRRLCALLAAAALGFTVGGCGTSTGPGNGGGGGGEGAATAGQETGDQPAAGGLKTPSYTAAHNSCSLFPLEELARQNGTKATPEAVARKIASGENTAKGKREAYKGCLDGIKAGG